MSKESYDRLLRGIGLFLMIIACSMSAYAMAKLALGNGGW